MISVIVPVYNCEKFIARCIESILSQTYRDLELLIVNDGSSDGSAAIIQQYAAKDFRIRYFEQENQGVSVARNRGIDEAAGTYIVFVDGDDFLENDALTQLMAHQNEFSYDCVSYMMQRIDLQNNVIGSNRMNRGTIVYSFENTFQFIQFVATGGGGAFFNVWSHLFNAEIIRRNNIRFTPGIVLGEDTLFCQKYSLFVNRGCILSDYVGYNYVKHAAECTAIHNDDWSILVEQPMLRLKVFADFVSHCNAKQRAYACLAYISWQLLTYIADFGQKTKDRKKVSEACAAPVIRDIVYPAIRRYAPMRRRILTVLFRCSPSAFAKVLKIA